MSFRQIIRIFDFSCLASDSPNYEARTLNNPQTKSYTWSQKSPQIFCRLDYWLVSNNLQDFVNSTEITPAIKTDHAAIEITLTDSYQNAKGPGLWKMNVSLLEDENYLKDLENKLPQWKMTGTNDLSNKRSVWDWLKFNIRNHAIFYSKKKAKERRIKEESLQTDYQIATKKFEEDPTVSNQNRLNEAKDALELFYEEKTKGIIIRAKARWHEHGERSTKYFLNLEKRNNVKKHIRKLLVSGAITTDPFKILDEQKRFFSQPMI